MAHHELDSIPNNDLSARDEFAVPQDVTFLNSSHVLVGFNHTTS
jgi:hypothetical protein